MTMHSKFSYSHIEIMKQNYLMSRTATPSRSMKAFACWNLAQPVCDWKQSERPKRQDCSQLLELDHIDQHTFIL
jgi:hypothetical protein